MKTPLILLTRHLRHQLSPVLGARTRLLAASCLLASLLVTIVPGTAGPSLRPEGSVFAWGLNGSGQTTVPASAQSGVLAIAAGGSHTVALVAPPEPALSAQRAGDELVLAWPASSGYLLEGAPTMNGPWTPVFATPVAEAGRLTLCVQTDQAADFYRLHRP